MGKSLSEFKDWADETLLGNRRVLIGPPDRLSMGLGIEVIGMNHVCQLADELRNLRFNRVIQFVLVCLVVGLPKGL
jgi:hypothetical protein